MSVLIEFAPVENFLGNRYKHVRSENIEELINHMDYGYSQRRKLRRSATVFLLKRFNCFYDEYEFIEMFSTKTAFIDGRTSCLPSYTWSNGWQTKRMYLDGNKMVKVQSGNKQIVTVWEFYENQLVMTISVDNVVWARKFYERSHDSTSGAFAWCEQWCID